MLVVGVFHPSLALGQAAGSWEHLAGAGRGLESCPWCHSESPGLRPEEKFGPASEQPCGRLFFWGVLGLSGAL